MQTNTALTSTEDVQTYLGNNKQREQQITLVFVNCYDDDYFLTALLGEEITRNSSDKYGHTQHTTKETGTTAIIRTHSCTVRGPVP